MNTRITFMGWAIALVAVVALGVALVMPRASAAQNPTTDSRKRITVVGHGEIKITPDVAQVTIGVQSEGQDAATALADNNAKMQALIDAIKNAGIAETDIQTVGFSIYPTYNYDSPSPQITGYQVSNAVNVKVAIAGAGDLLDKVVAVGANNVANIAFEVSNPAQALAEARQAAMNDAKLRADQFAGASNATVGQVLVISELVSQAPVFPVMERAADMGAAGNAVPIQPGQQIQAIDIQVTFELN
ncbi:MAG: SIMPL domain-containing protein [Herpetosiphonaceae bacterium]|nr:SIMPL domain-containing protein [Herpetosiphonaceae bacterium]